MKLISRILITLLALLLLILPGCSGTMLQEIPGELPEAAATPPPVDAAETAEFSAQLYFKTEDGLKLAAEQRTLTRPAEQGYVEALCEALSAGPESTSLLPSIPMGLSFARAELSAGVCSVYLTGTPPGNEQELLTVRAALAATMAANTEAEYVELFVNGVQPGYNGRPTGLLAPLEVSLDSYLSDAARESDSGDIAMSEATAFESRDFALYYTDSSRSLLVAQARTLGYERSSSLVQVIRRLLDLLMQGPAGSGGLESAIPADMRLMSTGGMPSIRLIPASAALGDELLYEPYDPELWRAPDGEELVVELRFTRPQGDFDEQLAYGAIVYAVTGVCPKVAGVRIYMDGEAVAPVGAVDCFMRADFSHLIGDMVTLAFPESDGSGLRSVLRCLPQEMAYDPLARTQALFTGSADPGVNYPGFAPEDLLSVSIQGDMAVVNWRAGFLETFRSAINEARSLLPRNTREQMIVYGVINTLTDLPGVERVWMLEDGERIGEAAELIHLAGPLLRNPGLILE